MYSTTKIRKSSTFRIHRTSVEHAEGVASEVGEISPRKNVYLSGSASQRIKQEPKVSNCFQVI